MQGTLRQVPGLTLLLHINIFLTWSKELTAAREEVGR